MENKTSKYFKYAIGEIVLVVIGILIALSLNNWNQNRVNKKTLSIYTNQLIEEVDLNISKLNKVIDEETKLSKHLDTVVDLLQNNDLTNPKLLEKSFALLSFEDFHPEMIAFDNLKSSGEFKLIDNIELRNAISSSYNSFNNVHLTQDVHYYNMKTRIAEYFMKNANYVDFSKSLPNFGKDLEFGNLAMAARSTLGQKIDACKSSKEKMDALKMRLEDFRITEFKD